MNKLDGRHLSEDTLQYLRHQAHELRNAGYTWNAISEALGVSRRCVITWASKYGIGGKSEPESVASGKHGRVYGENRTLTLAQETLVRDRIIEGSPSRLGLPYAMWTRVAVQQAIKVMWDIDMPIRTVGEYLRRWHFTPQRPAKHALEQRPVDVAYWLGVTYPEIVRHAKAEQGVIYWEDETAVRQDTVWIRGYSPTGHTPILEHAAQRPTPGITMISALNNQGLLRFEFHDGAVNSERFIGFMSDLVHDAQAKVFLIADNLKAHKSKNVQEWLNEHRSRIELFYLPPYSPELNPDEFVNRDLKTELRRRPQSRSNGALRALANEFMHSLCGMPNRIMKYFCQPHLVYASTAIDV